MKSLSKKWELFWNIIFDPWTLCLLIATIILICMSHSQTSSNSATATLLTILITLSSTVLGGRITKQWFDITEGGVLIARGKSAVRGLKLLLKSIISLDKRVQNYLTKTHSQKAPEVVITWLEEIRERCNILAEESVNSIENWTDIVPEADVKTHIGIISELRFKLENNEKDLKSLGIELTQTKDKSKEERKQLQHSILDKEKEIAKLQEELWKRQTGFGINAGIDSSSIISNLIIPTAGEQHVISLNDEAKYSTPWSIVDSNEDGSSKDED